MVDINRIERELFTRRKNMDDSGFIAYWESIKSNKEVLEAAIEADVNKYNLKMDFKCPTIVDCILSDYDSVDKEIYESLIKIIYSIPEIARTKSFNDSTFGMSYLVKSLMNTELKLNTKQKDFVIQEAIENNHTINTGYYDLRYYMLRNNSWSDSEKSELIKTFFSESELYDLLIQCEFDAISIMDQRRGYPLSNNEGLVFDYPYEKVSILEDEEDIPPEVKELLDFSELMHRINPYREEEKVFYIEY